MWRRVLHGLACEACGCGLAIAVGDDPRLGLLDSLRQPASQHHALAFVHLELCISVCLGNAGSKPVGEVEWRSARGGMEPWDVWL